MQKATLRQIMSVRKDIISFLQSKQISSFVFRPIDHMKNYPHLQSRINEQTVLEFNNEHRPLGSHGQMALFSFFNRLGIRCYMNTIPILLECGLNNREKAIELLKRFKNRVNNNTIIVNSSDEIEINGHRSESYEDIILDTLTYIFNHGSSEEVNDLIEIFEDKITEK